MEHAKLPFNEVKRIEAVEDLMILDTLPDLRIDCITQFLAHKFGVAISIVAIIDTDRAWFKSICGIDGLTEIPRKSSVCAHAIFDINITEPNGRVYEILDLKKDDRFFDAPFVLNKPNIQSYIGFVLQSESGENIGTLCLVDTNARKYTEDEKITFITAGLIIENIILGRHYYFGIKKLLH